MLNFAGEFKGNIAALFSMIFSFSEDKEKDVLMEKFQEMKPEDQNLIAAIFIAIYLENNRSVDKILVNTLFNDLDSFKEYKRYIRDDNSVNLDMFEENKDLVKTLEQNLLISRSELKSAGKNEYGNVIRWKYL